MSTRGRKPTRAEKILMDKHCYLPSEYLVVHNSQDELIIKSKYRKTLHTIKKENAYDSNKNIINLF